MKRWFSSRPVREDKIKKPFILTKESVEKIKAGFPTRGRGILKGGRKTIFTEVNAHCYSMATAENMQHN